MIDIFVTKGSNHRFPTKKYGNIDYIQRMYNREIDRVVEYYSNRNSRVRTEHVLSKLIFIVSPDYNLPITEYFRLVDSRAKYVSKQFDISSTINKGELVDVFYNGAPELLLYTEYSHNIFSFKDNWKNYNPVRIINTEDTNLDYRVFNKELNYYGTDFPVFEIDVITMCLMYKYWALERNLLEKSTHPSYFVYNIIFPNMIRQHMNMINFNRMIGTFYNELATSEGIKHPFMLSGYTKHIDAINNMYLRDVHNKPLKIRELISKIPTIDGSNMFFNLFINCPYYNRQNEWVLWISRFRYIIFFLELLGERGRNNNKDVMNELYINIRYIENGSTNIFNQIPNIFQDRVRTHIEKIKEICGRR